MIAIDTTSWTQEQINQVPAIAYMLATQSGQDIVPKWDGTNLDFGGVDLSKVVTTQSIIDGISSEQVKRDAALAQYKIDFLNYTQLKQSISIIDLNVVIDPHTKQVIQFLQLKDKLGIR